MTTLLQSSRTWAVVTLVVGLAWACEPWVRDPSPDPAHPAVFRTAWVSVGLGFAALALRLCDRRGQDFWAAGCVAFVVHLVVAFDVVHGWSHAAAFRHVEEASGFGPGIFVSYTFAVVWLIDAGWWSADPVGYGHRPGWVTGVVYGFLGFITFNGTVVYGVGFGRWLGAGGFALLAVLAVRHRLRQPPVAC